jgi:DNA-binding response OmpR family regulator
MKTVLIYDRNQELIEFWLVFLEKNGFIHHVRGDDGDLREVLDETMPEFFLLNADLPEASAIVGYVKTLLSKSEPKIVLYTTGKTDMLDDEVLGVRVVGLRDISPTSLKEIFCET